MKKSIQLIVFVVIAAGLIGLGSWYADKISEQSQAGSLAAGTQAAQTQSQIMANFKTEDTVVGTGAEAQNGETVSVLYTGTLDDGTVFDASSLHGNQPFSFTLGIGRVIKGWDLGVLGMKVGGTRVLTIPPELGYGSSAVSTIPPNSTLHFTVQLLSVSSSTASSTGN